MAWDYYKTITIDNTLVPSTLTDFPFLFSVTDTDISTSAQASGNDIAFFETDGTTQLSHEIEKYVTGTGELVAWVKIPSLSSATDKEIRVYYGDALAADQQDITGTWDSNFLMVQHMSQDPSGSAPQMLDSTSNARNLTSNISMDAGQLIPGKVGDGIDLNGINDYFTSPDFSIGGSVTVSVWSQSNWNTGQGGFYERGAINGGLTFFHSAGALIRLRGASATGINVAHGLANDELAYVVGTITGTSGEIFINGSSVVSGTLTAIDDTSASMRIGNLNSANNFTIVGLFDEFRLSSVVRSDDWITTEYNNQSDPATFHSVGSGVFIGTSDEDTLLLLGVG